MGRELRQVSWTADAVSGRTYGVTDGPAAGAAPNHAALATTYKKYNFRKYTNYTLFIKKKIAFLKVNFA